jgi:hypothetical protein
VTKSNGVVGHKRREHITRDENDGASLLCHWHYVREVVVRAVGTTIDSNSFEYEYSNRVLAQYDNSDNKTRKA